MVYEKFKWQYKTKKTRKQQQTKKKTNTIKRDFELLRAIYMYFWRFFQVVELLAFRLERLIVFYSFFKQFLLHTQDHRLHIQKQWATWWMARRIWCNDLQAIQVSTKATHTIHQQNTTDTICNYHLECVNDFRWVFSNFNFPPLFFHPFSIFIALITKKTIYKWSIAFNLMDFFLCFIHSNSRISNSAPVRACIA